MPAVMKVGVLRAPQLFVNATRFPLAISANGRYFVDRMGAPFFLLIDAAWSAAVQMTSAQMDTYLNDRAARGFSGFIVNLIEHDYTSQTPAYQNAGGANPFTTMTDFSTPNATYWQQVDYLLQGAKKRNLVAFAFPAYLGFTSAEGWQNEVTADTSAHLQTYGAFLANRYGDYGNIIWGLSGDLTATQSLLDKQWNIVTGMRTARADQLIYVKPARGSGAQSTGSGYSLLVANGGTARYPGFNVNNTYVQTGDEASTAAVEYARAGPYPFVMDESTYDGESTTTPRNCRQQAWATALSGACGYGFGNNPIWPFGCPNPPNAFYTGGNAAATTGAANVLVSTFLGTTATQHVSRVQALFASYAWQLLAPKTDTSFVTTSLSTGASTICAALASDNSFGMVFTPDGTGFTVDMTRIGHTNTRARWFDPTSSAFTTDAASPLANTGTHAFTTPGTNAGGDPDWVLVID